MYTLEADNVRDALPNLVNLVLQRGFKEETRGGPVIALHMPITIHYLNAKQHVLINPIRDANPFFHLMEAMWMLAGRQDGAFLDYYIKDFSKKYGNNGIIMDSYGFRWRYGLRYDQIKEIINQLRKTPTTRQAVLQMWGAGNDDLRTSSAKPCNLVITFRIVDNQLDMIVFNRSNDLIFGCCGANAVHFPILQEYIAGMIGVEMGEYWQISTNLHLYTEHRDMLQNRINKEKQNLPISAALMSNRSYELTLPLIKYPNEFDNNLKEVMVWIDDLHNNKEEIDLKNLPNPFLQDVIIPMARAHYFYKKKAWTYAFEEIDNVAAEDWKRAGYEWIMRRFPGAPKVEATDAS